MTNELLSLLAHVGYEQRSQQTALFDHLTHADHDGVIAQAGTGVGKSLAVLAAAAHAYKASRRQSLVVTPTRVLMDQYMAADAPAAAEALGVSIAELRGRTHYWCGISAQYAWGGEYLGGCDEDACTTLKWDEMAYECGYQEAKAAARDANIVVTNTDFLIVNDRLLGPLEANIFDLDGALFVDEAHQLEAKMRDWASKSLNGQRLKRHSHGQQLGDWILRAREGRLEVDNPELQQMVYAMATAPTGPDTKKRERELIEGARAIYKRMQNPHPDCVVHVKDEAIKMDWVSVAPSARELLTARPFALVSATVPQSMPVSLGVPGARFVDVGHPFDYANQATLGVSEIDGAFKYSGPANLKARADEVMREIDAAGGGALLLFSSFKDLEDVHDYLKPQLAGLGLTVLRQGGDDPTPNDELAAAFRADGNAVLFGSESFATGFDVPGDALRLVVVWKLPYPGKDPVTETLMRRYYPRYLDGMKMRIVQGIGRLIRRETDTGRVWIADSRAETVVADRGAMTAHLAEFRRA